MKKFIKLNLGILISLLLIFTMSSCLATAIAILSAEIENAPPMSDNNASIYKQQEGWAFVSGRDVHYWLYDSDLSDMMYFHTDVVPNWYHNKGYTCVSQSISYPNTVLADSVKELMKFHNANISITLIDEDDEPYAVLNRCINNKYSTTIYYLSKKNTNTTYYTPPPRTYTRPSRTYDTYEPPEPKPPMMIGGSAKTGTGSYSLGTPTY